MTPARLKIVIAQIAKALDETTVPTTPPRVLTVIEKYTCLQVILSSIMNRETIEIP